jgi:hypothetical protein
MEQRLLQKLADVVGNSGLTELHTHLTGMGSAAFWVTSIMNGYIRAREAQDSKRRVLYSLSDLMIASGYVGYGNRTGVQQTFSDEVEESLFESTFFDGFNDVNLGTANFFVRKDGELFLPNGQVLAMMSAGPPQFSGLVRSWFQFLQPNGTDTQLPDYLRICKYFFILAASCCKVLMHYRVFVGYRQRSLPPHVLPATLHPQRSDDGGVSRSAGVFNQPHLR